MGRDGFDGFSVVCLGPCLSLIAPPTSAYLGLRCMLAVIHPPIIGNTQLAAQECVRDLWSLTLD